MTNKKNAQTKRIEQLRSENTALRKELGLVFELDPEIKPRVAEAKEILRLAEYRLEHLQKDSPKIPEARESRDEAMTHYYKVFAPIQELTDAIEENDLAIEQISTSMVQGQKEHSASRDDERDGKEASHGVMSIMESILELAVMKSFQFIIMQKNGIDFTHEEYEEDPEKREILEAMNWITQDGDPNFYEPEFKVNQETEKRQYVGPYTFDYLCSCLSFDPNRIRRAILYLQEKPLEEVEAAVARFRNKETRMKFNPEMETE